MTALTEAFGMEASGMGAADKGWKEPVMAVVGDMIVGDVVGTLEQERSVLQEAAEGIEHKADMGHIVAEA